MSEESKVIEEIKKSQKFVFIDKRTNKVTTYKRKSYAARKPLSCVENRQESIRIDNVEPKKNVSIKAEEKENFANIILMGEYSNIKKAKITKQKKKNLSKEGGLKQNKENTDYPIFEDSDKENRPPKNIDSKPIKHKIPLGEARTRALKEMSVDLESKKNGKDENKKLKNEDSKELSKVTKLRGQNKKVSEDSIKRQLSSLKLKKYPFRYSEKPRNSTKSNKIKQTVFEILNPEKEDFSEAIQPIINHLLNTESIHVSARGFDFLPQQIDISPKMRCVLIDWLGEMCQSFDLSNESYLLALDLIDRFLALKQITRSKFQLLGCAAMFIATKFIEVSPPVANDFVFVSDNSFDSKQLVGMESLILNLLKWKVVTPPHYFFACQYLALAKATKAQKIFCNYLVEISHYELEVLKRLPSVVTAACAFVSLHLENRYIKSNGIQKDTDSEIPVRTREVENIWKNRVEKRNCPSVSQIKDCVVDLKNLLLDSNRFENSATQKYSNEKLLNVAQAAEIVCRNICFSV